MVSSQPLSGQFKLTTIREIYLNCTLNGVSLTYIDDRPMVVMVQKRKQISGIVNQHSHRNKI